MTRGEPPRRSVPHQCTSPAKVAPRTSYPDTGSRTSLVPLLGMAFAFFLPATIEEGCNTPPITLAPIDIATRDVPGLLLLAPTYGAAALLAFAVFFAWTTRRDSSILGAVAVALCFVSMMSVGVMLADSPKTLGVGVLVCVIVAAAATALAVWGSHQRGLRRLSLFVDVYAAFASPIALLNIVWARRYGAFVFVASYAALVVVRVTHAILRWSVNVWDARVRARMRAR